MSHTVKLLRTGELETEGDGLHLRAPLGFHSQEVHHWMPPGLASDGEAKALLLRILTPEEAYDRLRRVALWKAFREREHVRILESCNANPARKGVTRKV